MCLPLPFQVAELLDDDMARVTLGDVTEIVSLELIEDARVGDYVILHGTCALTRLDAADAQDMVAQLGAAA